MRHINLFFFLLLNDFIWKKFNKKYCVIKIQQHSQKFTNKALFGYFMSVGFWGLLKYSYSVYK